MLGAWQNFQQPDVPALKPIALIQIRDKLMQFDTVEESFSAGSHPSKSNAPPKLIFR